MTTCSKDHPCVATQSLSYTQLTPSTWLVPRAKGSLPKYAVKKCWRRKDTIKHHNTKLLQRPLLVLAMGVTSAYWRAERRNISQAIDCLPCILKSSAPCTVDCAPSFLCGLAVIIFMASWLVTAAISMNIIITAVHWTVFLTVCHMLAARPSLPDGFSSSHIFPSWFSCVTRILEDKLFAAIALISHPYWILIDWYFLTVQR